MDRKKREGIAIQNLRSVLSTPAGKHFFQFLLEEFNALDASPPTNFMTPNQLVEEIAHKRMGSFIMSYITKADPSVLGHLMALIAKEKQDEYVSENPAIENESSAKPEWELG